MILEIYCVYDSKASYYMQPVYMQSRGHAIRSFIDLSNDTGSFVGKNPEDYTLFKVGTYDDSVCRFELLPTPESVGKAIEFVKS